MNRLFQVLHYSNLYTFDYPQSKSKIMRGLEYFCCYLINVFGIICLSFPAFAIGMFFGDPGNSVQSITGDHFCAFCIISFFSFGIGGSFFRHNKGDIGITLILLGYCWMILPALWLLAKIIFAFVKYNYLFFHSPHDYTYMINVDLLACALILLVMWKSNPRLQTSIKNLLTKFKI